MSGTRSYEDVDVEALLGLIWLVLFSSFLLCVASGTRTPFLCGFVLFFCIWSTRVFISYFLYLGGCVLLLKQNDGIVFISVFFAVFAVRGIFSVLNQKRGHVFQEMQLPRTPLYNMKAYLPVIECFGLSAQLRASTSGQAFPQCVFHHWEMMMSDPLEATSQAAQLVTDIRKRKGLKEQMTPLSEFEDKL
ncbi:unnamed protein product [Prunus brigantina]